LNVGLRVFMEHIGLLIDTDLFIICASL